MDTTTTLLDKSHVQVLHPESIARRPATGPKAYHTPDTLYTRYLKRGLDVVIALTLTVLLLSWMIPILFVLIRLTSKGPLFFVQDRIGYKGRKFSCLKFRTMLMNSESHTSQARFDDRRVTKIGLFLRVTHIDELPQLINVLRNEMSLIGPRPHMLYHDELFTSVLPQYPQRHLVKPGITGLAQSAGFHGATPDYASIANRTRLDLFYVTRVSFGLDLKILLTTLLVSSFKHFRK